MYRLRADFLTRPRPQVATGHDEWESVTRRIRAPAPLPRGAHRARTRAGKCGRGWFRKSAQSARAPRREAFHRLLRRCSSRFQHGPQKLARTFVLWRGEQTIGWTFLADLALREEAN